MAPVPAFCGSCSLHSNQISLPCRQPQLRTGRLGVGRLALQHRPSSARWQPPGRRAPCRPQASSNVEVEEAPAAQREPAAEAADAPAAAAGTGPGGGEGDGEQQKPERVGERWQEVIRMQAEGEVITGRIKTLSKSGVVVELPNKLRGFLPWSRMDRGRLPASEQPNEGELQRLMGKRISVKVVQVNIPKKQILLSEQAALFSEWVAGMSVGEVVEGYVNGFAPFGAFVNLRSPDGVMRGLNGMIHISQLSWDRVNHPEDVLQVGQAVRCKLVKVDLEKEHIYLSLKQMETDPLLENLDGLLPLDQPSVGSVPANLPSAVEDLCAGLSAEPGIDDVSVGRQVEEKRAVSQDLELWISKEAVEDGHNLVVRAGRLVQEIHVTTRLPGDAMKETVQRVLRQLV